MSLGVRDETSGRGGVPVDHGQSARKIISPSIITVIKMPNADLHMEGPIRKESGKRGRKPGRKAADKVDMRAKLERSRQSARECRARKKLRYQYLEELVADREKAVFALRKEFERYTSWAKDIDEGRMPEGIQELLEEFGALKQEQ